MNAWLLLVANALGRLGDHESQRMDMGMGMDMDMDMGMDSAADSALDSALDSYPPVALPDLSAAPPPAPPAGAAATPASPKKRAGGVDASYLGELVSLKNLVELKRQELAAVDARASVHAESVPHMDTAAAHLDAAKARMDPAVHAQALAHMTAALAHVDAAKAQMAAAHAGGKATGAGQGAGEQVKDAGSSSQHLTAGAGRAAAGGRATGSATLKQRLDALVAGMTREVHKSSKSVRTGATEGVRLNTTPDEYNTAITDTQNSVNMAVHDVVGQNAALSHPLHQKKAQIDNLIVQLNRLLGHNDTAGTPLTTGSTCPVCFSATPEPVHVVVQGYQIYVPVHTAGEAVAPQDVADYTDAFSRHLTLQWADQVKLQLEALYTKLTTQEGLEDPTTR